MGRGNDGIKAGCKGGRKRNEEGMEVFVEHCIDDKIELNRDIGQ